MSPIAHGWSLFAERPKDVRPPNLLVRNIRRGASVTESSWLVRQDGKRPDWWSHADCFWRRQVLDVGCDCCNHHISRNYRQRTLVLLSAFRTNLRTTGDSAPAVRQRWQLLAKRRNASLCRFSTTYSRSRSRLYMSPIDESATSFLFDLVGEFRLQRGGQRASVFVSTHFSRHSAL